MRDLLSPLGLARLADDMRTSCGCESFCTCHDLGPEGTDVAMGIDEAEREPLTTLVLCPEDRYVPEGFECPHTCKPGECTGCPAVLGKGGDAGP